MGQDEARNLDFLSDDLVEKCDSFLVARSDAEKGEVCTVICNRVEQEEKEVDHEPFAVLASGSEAITEGVMVHHADYPGRTHRPPEPFFTAVSNSGIGQCLDLETMPDNSSGDIDKLKQKAASQNAIREGHQQLVSGWNR